MDGNLIIDQWHDQGPTEYTRDIDLGGGSHSLKVEYYENSGGATVALWWDALGSGCPAITDWQGEYWNNQGLSGNPVLCRNDRSVDFNWGDGGPGGGVPNDHFSARWTRNWNFAAGRYRFHLRGDDGIRLVVDGNSIIDQWHDQGPTEYTRDIDLSGGSHSLKVEYYENSGGATVALWWDSLGSGGGPAGYTFCAQEGQRCSFSGTKDVAYGANGRFNYRYGITGGIDCNNSTFGDPIPGVVKACYTKDASSSCPTITDWKGEYWNNQGLSGNPVLCRNDRSVDFNWGDGGPGGGVPNDHFSARWTRNWNFAAGRYRFHLRGDDGIRLVVDGNSIIDQWHDQGPTEYTRDIDLSGGSHSLKVEYYENSGGATVALWWDGPITTCPVYRAEYYNNRSLSGSPTFTQCEDWPINHDWGNGGPGGGVGDDNFSARWTGRAHIAAGTYNFIARADDGIRVWIGGGNPIIDQWHDQGPTEYRVTRNVSDGDYDVKVEYYENSGGAVAQFRWERASSGSGNLALNKPSWATSQESSAYEPRFGNDGNMGTRWSSGISSSLPPQWYKIDLGSAQTFNRFVVRWEAAYAAHYWVGWCDNNCTSNDSTWYGFERWLGSAQNDVIDFSSQAHRYVGVYMINRAPRMNNYSFWEFEVYNAVGASDSEPVGEPQVEILP